MIDGLLGQGKAKSRRSSSFDWPKRVAKGHFSQLKPSHQLLECYPGMKKCNIGRRFPNLRSFSEAPIDV
jgi:hypothetical protein